MKETTVWGMHASEHCVAAPKLAAVLASPSPMFIEAMEARR